MKHYYYRIDVFRRFGGNELCEHLERRCIGFRLVIYLEKHFISYSLLRPMIHILGDSRWEVRDFYLTYRLFALLKPCSLSR